MSAGVDNQPLSARARRQARAALTHTYAEARRMPGNLLPQECVDQLLDAARAIVYEVGGGVGAAPQPTRPADCAERTITSTVVGLLVGTRVIDEDQKLAELGTGLFLKDIGELALPPRLVQKQEPLAAGEAELLEQHPLLGLELVREHQAAEAARSVVRSHHERWDGSGYPDLLAGEAIPPLARIAAVADAFTGPNGLHAVRAGAGSALDPQLTAVLTELADMPRLAAA